MRWFRLVAGAALLCLAVLMVQRRDPIVEAYTEERPPAQIEFDGLDFNLTNRTDVGPSPLVVPAAPDTSATTLTAVALTGPTPDPAELPVGSMRLGGTVRHGAAPVPYATVRLEHHRSGDPGGSPVVAVADVVADELGQWSIDGVAGGRWRARGFVPGLLGSSGSIVQFIAPQDSFDIDLTVAEPDPRLVLDLAAPPSMLLGEQRTIVVTAGVRRVDAEGMFVTEPIAGATVALTLAPDAVLRPLSATTATTSQTGAAAFGFSCDIVGPSSVTAAVNASVSVSVPGPAPEPNDALADSPDAPPIPPIVSVEQRSAGLSVGLPVCELPPPPPEEATDEDAPSPDQSASPDGDANG